MFAALPKGSRIAMRARQAIAIGRGERTLDPELAAVAETLANTPAASPDDRETLAMAGVARLLASDARGAAPLLQAASGGEPEALAEMADAAEPASLLVIALRRIGETEAAEAWQGPLEKSTSAMLASTRARLLHQLRARRDARDARRARRRARRVRGGVQGRLPRSRAARARPARGEPAERAAHEGAARAHRPPTSPPPAPPSTDRAVPPPLLRRGGLGRGNPAAAPTP